MDADTPTTVLMQVQLSDLSADEDARMKTRFGRFYSPTEFRVEYPVSCDSHGFDVFRDEFVATDMQHAVDAAWLIELPFPSDHFVPFTDDNSGTVIDSLSCEICGSITDKHTDDLCFK